MYVLIDNKNELNKFRFWYLNRHDVDVKERTLHLYFKGDYSLPCVVDMNDKWLGIENHQNVTAQEMSWDDWVTYDETGKNYKNWNYITLDEFMKAFNE